MPCEPEKRVRLFAVVLAAGAARRFGSTKQLAAIDGESLVRRAVRLAEAVCGPRTVLVTGADWRRVFEACGQLRGFLVRNDRYADGMSSSIAAGVRTVEGAADAMLLMLADQPLITESHLENLIGCWSAAPDTIVASGYAGVAGPPAIFPAAFFRELASLEGDAGARAIIAANEERVQRVDFEDAAVDVDRPADLTRLR